MNTKSSHLQDKVALITGASRGLGAAAAKRLARDGAFVLINYAASAGHAQAVLDEIVAAGGQGAVVRGDVSSVAGITALFEHVDAALAAAGRAPKIDILLANAGISLAAPIEAVQEADFDALMNINVKGVFFVVQQALSRINDGGRILTVSSGLSRFSIPYYIAYSATKGWVDVFTRHLALHLGPRGITVNAIAPGAIDTDFNADWLKQDGAREQMASMAALQRVGMPDDIADVIGFLAGPDSRWITGQRIEASGGAHL